MGIGNWKSWLEPGWKSWHLISCTSVSLFLERMKIWPLRGIHCVDVQLNPTWNSSFACWCSLCCLYKLFNYQRWLTECWSLNIIHTQCGSYLTGHFAVHSAVQQVSAQHCIKHKQYTFWRTDKRHMLHISTHRNKRSLLWPFYNVDPPIPVCRANIF